VFPRNKVCLRTVCVDTLHKGDIDDITIKVKVKFNLEGYEGPEWE
jgi:hypothetical protein